MIRFGCPSCQNVLEVPPERAGTKMPCSKCGQRLLVPGQADLNKTVPGQLVAAVIARQTNLASTPQPSTPSPIVVPPRESKWFFVREGRRQGPVSAGQLAQFYAAGQVREADLVWTEGMPGWEPAQKALPRFAPPVPQPAPLVRPVQKAPAAAVAPPARSRTPLFVAVAACGVLSTLVALGVGTALVLGSRNQPTTEQHVSSTTPTAPTASTAPVAPKTAEQIVEECAPSVARVHTPLSNGSGFLVEGGLVVTNWHVLADAPADSIRVSFPQGPEAARTPALAELVYVNPKRDIAVLRLDARLPPVKVASGPAFKAGERIVVIGSPGVGGGAVLENAVTDGILSSQTTLRGLNWYHITAAINPGNSGGPVFNPRGEVVGVVTFYIAGKQTMNFAVPAEDVRRALEEARNPSREELDVRAANHNASVVFYRLHEAGQAHLQLIKEIITAMDLAQKDRRDPADAHAAVLKDTNVNNRRALAQRHIRDIEAIHTQVSRSDYPAPALRQALQDFKTLQMDIARHVSVNAPLSQYRRKFEDLEQEFKRQRSDLQRLTGVSVVE